MSDFSFPVRPTWSSVLAEPTAQPATDEDHVKTALSLMHSGTVHDLEVLTNWLSRSTSTAELRSACCNAISAIARRKGFSGEQGRPLQRLIQQLDHHSRYDQDRKVCWCATEALQAVDEATAYLPAWTLSEGSIEPAMESSSPYPSAPSSASPQTASRPIQNQFCIQSRSS